MSYADAGMAANIAGGEIQGWASLFDKWAMAQAYQAAAKQQQGFQQQAMSTFHPEQFGTTAMQQGVQQGANARKQAYAGVEATPLSFSTPGKNTIAQDRAWTDMIGTARAGLGGYSDWATQQAIKNLQTQNQLNQISNFAGGTAGLLPLNMYAAQHSNDTLSAIGQAISSIGGGAANYGQLLAGTPPQQGQVPTYGMGGGNYQGGNPPPVGTMYDPTMNQSTYNPYSQFAPSYYQFSPG